MGKISEIGNRYGRWTVLSYAGTNKYRTKKWFCRCDCGSERVVYANILHNGRSKSCGCLKRELVSKLNFKDETGNRYNRLLVMEEAGRSVAGNALWRCMCDCGNSTIVDGSSLRNGSTQSCGCYRDQQTSKRGLKEEIGNIYGRLTVIEAIDKRSSDRNVVWRCKCSCGNIVEIDGHSLRSGNTKSCGCLQRERMVEVHTIHGMCANGGSPNYPPEWTYSFREVIRERDSRVCQICGTTEKEENKSLSVHHIDYNRDNTTEENCISLCNSCHSKTNFHRKYWKKYFKELKEENNGKD